MNGLGLLEQISMMSGSLKIIVFGTLLGVLCVGRLLFRMRIVLRRWSPGRGMLSGQGPDSFSLLLDPIFDEKESCW